MARLYSFYDKQYMELLDTSNYLEFNYLSFIGFLSILGTCKHRLVKAQNPIWGVASGFLVMTSLVDSHLLLDYPGSSTFSAFLDFKSQLYDHA